MKTNKRLILFSHKRALGDALMFSCLYHDSDILLSNNKKRYIGTIVNKKEYLKVKSYNIEKDKFENKNINNFIKRKIDNKTKWYFLTYKNAKRNNKRERRGIFLTGDHEVFTLDSKKRIDELNNEDKILTTERSFNDKQKKIFIGMILGDSCLRNLKYNNNRSVFSFKHSIRQKEWFYLKYNCFKDFHFHVVVDKAYKNNSESFTAYTNASAYFGYLRKKWYPNGIRTLKNNLSYKDFSWLSLVVWYLDNGSLYRKNNALALHNYYLTRKNLLKLIDILKYFGIKAKLYKKSKNKFIIYIGNGYDKENSADRFFKNIVPYVPYSLRYKIPKKYHYINFNKKLWRINGSKPYYDDCIVIKKNPPIKKISSYSYCLEIDDNHNFIVNNIIVSNCGIRDFSLLFPSIKINVDTNQPAIFENNPYIDKTVQKGQPEVEYYRVGYPMVGNINNSNMHFTSMFLFDMIAIADLHNKLPVSLGEFCAIYANGTVGDPTLSDREKNAEAKEPFISLRKKYGGKEFDKNSKFPHGICELFSRQRGDIHLSQAEKENNVIKNIYDINKYWVIAPGGKRDCTSKIWDWRRFQDVIDYFEGRLKFVVIGKSDLLVEKLNNVIDLTDKFNSDIRGLISLVYHADGCVAGPSFLMHLAAAIPSRFRKERKPCVSIFGGREPTAWSWYCNHQILHTNGIFDCCDNGGCWTARTYPLPKDPKHNENLCKHTIEDNGRTIQQCMNTITAKDVIRAIEKYYEGNIYKYEKTKKKIHTSKNDENITVHTSIKHENTDIRTSEREINMVGNLNSKGGGEQSLFTIAKLFKKRGWNVHLYPWSTTNSKFVTDEFKVEQHSFQNGMVKNMKEGLPLLFYANDCVSEFCKSAQELVDKSSDVLVGINYVNNPLPKTEWVAKSNKLRTVIFQNEEKKSEFERDSIGFDNTKLITLYGAIELDKFLEVCSASRKDKNDELVVLKHSVADYRKYVTNESAKGGEKIHIWQKHISKEPDTKFYERLLKDTQNIRFEFMEAHKELSDHFINNFRIIFHKWDSMPVTEFLKRGHVYLYRASNMWRDQFPRVLAEALAVGLPALVEPRDGTKDRVIHGDTGLYCIDYDSFLYGLKLFQRKEDYRAHLGRNAKDWARMNLNPEKWVDIVEEVLVGR